MIFVDTGAWFASIVPTDPNHQKAAKWLEANNEILLTTDYIVDETLTLRSHLINISSNLECLRSFREVLAALLIATNCILTEKLSKRFCRHAITTKP